MTLLTKFVYMYDRVEGSRVSLSIQDRIPLDPRPCLINICFPHKKINANTHININARHCDSGKGRERGDMNVLLLVSYIERIKSV